jgi:hypothetical protein
LEYLSIVTEERKRDDGHHSPIEIDTGMDAGVLLTCTCSKFCSCRVSHRGKSLQVDCASERDLLLVVIELPHAIDDEANVGRALVDPNRSSSSNSDAQSGIIRRAVNPCAG